MTNSVKLYIDNGVLKADQNDQQFSTPLDSPVLLTIKVVNAEGGHVDVTTSILMRDVVTMMIVAKVVNVQ